MISAFHFLRPWWLVGVLIAIGVWVLQTRQQHWQRTLGGALAPHLAKHLTVTPKSGTWFGPQNVLTFLWCLASIAMAGPSARLQPNPFADDQAGLFIILRLGDSMENTDLLPSRLERARIKLKNLLDARAGAPTGLIAYSGTAHLVMPMTTDAEVIDYQLQALRPELMPMAGDDASSALQLATERLRQSPAGGSILLVTDSISQEQIAICDDLELPPVQIWAPLTDTTALGATGLEGLGDAIGAPVLTFAVDESDVATIDRRCATQITAANGQDAARWADDGYWLLPMIALLTLLWCRRGWSVV
ncbi:MAG TPA: hypothetical protein DDW52_09370 [Planctomycetaceae bacterium]|nr:hypothetical protein [Planctomycetaceae bacterium]